METKSNKQIDLRRAVLIELSIKAREYREKQLKSAKTEQQLLYWSSIRINDIIAGWYKQESGAKEFKTFKQWNIDGYNIKKGEKAFILWSKKRSVAKQAVGTTEQGEPTDIGYEFFPIAYLFSDLQVDKMQEGGNNVD